MSRAGMRGAALLLLAAATVGCGGSAGDSDGRRSTGPPPPTSTSTTVAPTTTTLTAEDAVKAAWNDYWRVVERLLQAPNPDDPDLPTVADEPLLSFVRDDLATRLAGRQHVVLRPDGKYVHRFVSASISDSSAAVRGCQLDDSITETLDGEIVDDSVATRQLSATFKFRAGAWRAVDVRVVSEIQGLVGCDA